MFIYIVQKALHIQSQRKFSRCPLETVCRKVFLLEDTGFQSIFAYKRFISVFSWVCLGRWYGEELSGVYTKIFYLCTFVYVLVIFY